MLIQLIHLAHSRQGIQTVSITLHNFIPRVYLQHLIQILQWIHNIRQRYKTPRSLVQRNRWSFQVISISECFCCILVAASSH